MPLEALMDEGSPQRELVERAIGREEPVKYDTKGVPVARVIKPDDQGYYDEGDIIHIDFSTATHVRLCARSGEGKTVLAEAAASRAVDKGAKLFHGSDVNGDMKSIDRHGGIQREELDKIGSLLPGEERREYSRELFIPKFMTEHYSIDRVTWGNKFSFGFDEISTEDFRKLIDLDGWSSDAQTRAVEAALQNLDFDSVNWNTLMHAIKKESGRSVEKIAQRLSPVRDAQVIDNRWRQSIPSRLEDVDVVSLFLHRYQKARREWVQFIAGVLYRELASWLRERQPGFPTIFFGDEFHWLCPRGDESLATEEFDRLLTWGARRGDLSTILCTQKPAQLPYGGEDPGGGGGRFDFMSSAGHYFIGRGLSWPDWKAVLHSTDTWHNAKGPGERDSTAKNEWRNYRNLLGRHQFVYIPDDRFADAGGYSGPWDCPIVESLPPLWHHGGYSERSERSDRKES